MSRKNAEANVLSLFAPISATVCEMLDTKVIPVIEAMPRREAGAKLGMDGSAVTHYLRTGEQRTSMPTLPMIERLAALAGFRTEVSFVRDSTIAETILGDVDPSTYVAGRRGRPPLSPEVRAERDAAKVKKEKPRAKPVVVGKVAATESKPAKKTPKAAPAKKAAAKSAAPVKKNAKKAVAATPKKAPTKAAQGF